jgi:distribution and morphology protein 12
VSSTARPDRAPSRRRASLPLTFIPGSPLPLARSQAMSLDIDWSLLSDPALTDGIVDAFNRYLATADRPSFLGPISVSSFDFGSRAPDVEVVGLGDVYPDFLADDEDDAGTEDGGESSQDGAGGRWQDGMSSAGGGRSGSRDWSQGGSHLAHYHQDGFGRDGYGFPHQPQTADDVFSAAGGRARSSYSAAPGRDQRSSAAGGPFASPLAGYRPHFASVYTNHSPFTSRVGLSSALPTPMATPFLSRNPSFASLPLAGGGGAPVSRGGSPSSHVGGPDFHSTTPDEHTGDHMPAKPSNSGAPSLQLHVHVHHQADIRFSLSTTLLINHPSPAFMSLPLTLTVTEVEVDWHVVLAYQAESERPAPGASVASKESNGRRVHLSILDPLDPYGPPAPGTSTPPLAPHLGESKTPPAGERLIPRMSMESSIGQEGDRVLRNVAKVERCVRPAFWPAIHQSVELTHAHILQLRP